MEKCRKNRDATPFGCDDSIPCTWLCGRGGLRSSNFSINSREIPVAGVDLISYIMFWILYFIFIPIAIVCCWMDFTVLYNGIIKWKDITIGEFISCVGIALIPVVNIVVPLICLIDLLIKTGWLDKPLLRK